MEPTNSRLSRTVLDQLTAIEQVSGGIESRFLNLFGTVCANLGKNIEALENEHAVLASKNKILAGEITQLKLVHTAELYGAVDGFSAARNLMIEKLNAIIERMNAFPDKYKCCGYIPLNPMPFQYIVEELRSKALEHHFSQLRIYPEYCDRRLNKDLPEEQMLVVSVSNIPVSLLEQPIIIELSEKIDSLVPMVAPLRDETYKLMKEKAIIIDFHRRHLEDLNRAEKLGRIKEVVEKVRAIYNNIQWEIPTTNGMECADCHQRIVPGSCHPTVRANLIIQGHPLMQKEVQESMNHVREHVLMAVNALEALIL